MTQVIRFMYGGKVATGRKQTQWKVVAVGVKSVTSILARLRFPLWGRHNAHSSSFLCLCVPLLLPLMLPLGFPAVPAFTLPLHDMSVALSSNTISRQAVLLLRIKTNNYPLTNPKHVMNKSLLRAMDDGDLSRNSGAPKET